jgi:hypothetical protein
VSFLWTKGDRERQQSTKPRARRREDSSQQEK